MKKCLMIFLFSQLSILTYTMQLDKLKIPKDHVLVSFVPWKNNKFIIIYRSKNQSDVSGLLVNEDASASSPVIIRKTEVFCSGQSCEYKTDYGVIRTTVLPLESSEK